MSEESANLVLYDFPAKPADERWASYSPFVLEVERALRLAKLPFRHERINMLKLKQFNPLGQLPVLGIGSELVTDSTRILMRIEQLAPGTMTGGLDERGAAEAWLWEEFADTALYPHVLATRWIDERGWPMVRSAFFGAIPQPLRSLIAPAVRRKQHRALVGRDFLRGGLESCNERLARVLDQLEARAPEAGFWLGARPSAADLGLFAHLHALRFPELPWRAGDIAKRARLSRWLDRVEAATSAA
jgi:glutathione S-transferase